MSTAAEEATTPSRPQRTTDVAGELINTIQSHIKVVEKRLESFEKTTDARAASIEKTISSGINRVLFVGSILVLVVLVGMFCGTMYMVSLIAVKSNIDTHEAATSTSTIISTASDAVTTTTATLTGGDAGTTTTTVTTPAVPSPAPTDATDTQPEAPTGTEH